MFAGDVVSIAADGSVERRHVGAVAAAVRPRRTGGSVIAVERGFVLEEPDGTLMWLAELWSDPRIRMNEGGCDPDGRFYCGSMELDQRPGAGTVYRLDPDRSVHVVLKNVSGSNGLDWSPDGSRAYYVDSPTQRIAVFGYDAEAGLTRGRWFAEVRREDGIPDGLTVDAEGGVWVALYGGGAVRRYTPDGDVDEIVEVPTPNVTACAFGGAGVGELFITTSSVRADPPAGEIGR